MKPLTYRTLLEALKELDSDKLDMSVTFIDENNEAIPVMDLSLVSELGSQYGDLDDVLDIDQPVLLSKINK